MGVLRISLKMTARRRDFRLSGPAMEATARGFFVGVPTRLRKWALPTVRMLMEEK